MICTLSQRTAARSLLPCSAGPARYLFESMSIRPYLSALRLSHLIGSNVVDGTGISAALSSSNASPMTTSLRQCLDAAASASHLSSMIRPSCVWVSPPPAAGP